MANTNPTPPVSGPSDTLPSYRAYLVRCWRERVGASTEEPIWRFSLDAPWYKERRGFSSLEALMDHLQVELMTQMAGPVDEHGQAFDENTTLENTEGGLL